MLRLTFDRGTILFDADPGPLPSVEHDPRIGLWRAPAFRHAELCAELARAGRAFRDEAVPALPPPERFRAIPLRPYQRDALRAWRDGRARGVVVLPTGAGKTRVAIAAIAELRARSLCLVPTRVLLEQWEKALLAFQPGPIGVIGDGQRRLEPITVATFASARRRMAEIGNRFELLIVDEAHHFGGGQNDEALWMCTAPMRLGLTATPATSEALVVALGPVVFELGIAELVGTHLAPLAFVELGIELTAEERRCYDADEQSFGAARRAFLELAPRGSWDEFITHTARSASGREALAAWRRMHSSCAFPAGKRRLLAELLVRHREMRTLVFTADAASAYAIAREHLVMPITSEIGREEREKALALYRAGALRTLVSARVLNEGFDVPDAEIGIIVGAALGARELQQRVGRLLRPAPGKRAIVYTLVARRTLEERRARRKRDALRI